ncbi:MAG: hypothetical protein ACE5IR_08535 [bacterium]
MHRRRGEDGRSDSYLSKVALGTLFPSISVIPLKVPFQVWSDWKRTDYPVITQTPGNREIPRRLIYPGDERNTNPNMTQQDTFLTRNVNALY